MGSPETATDMCLTATFCTVFPTQDAQGTMSVLDTSAAWRTKMTTLDGKELSHNVHIYAALWKGPGSLAV